MSRVLVVDNDNLVKDVCTIALNTIGHEVKCAHNGETAIEMIRAGAYQLVIVNNYLEGISGIDAFQLMKQTEPALRGILITKTDNADTIIRAMNAGFSRVCRLPVDAKEIVGAVSETLKIAKLRDDITRLNTLVPLYNLTQRFLSAGNEKQLFEELIETVSVELGVPSVSVMMFDKKKGVLKVVAYRGLRPEHVESLEIKPGERVSGKVFQSKNPIILNKASQHLSPYRNLLQRKELQAAISLPLCSKDKILGVLNVSETVEGCRFQEADLEMLLIICDQAIMAFENIRTNQEREEQSRIRALLEQYVSPEVSKILVTSRKDLMEVGEVLCLTILFADIRNFTLLVQHLPTDHLRDFLNVFFDGFASTVFKHNGMLDKFMGDAALVVFGAPATVDRPSYTAVKMARELMHQFHQLIAERKEKYPVFKNIGLTVGISRGPVFLGNIGSPKRVDYTVIGKDVNIAQRLASETASGQILLTSRVAEDLHGAFELDEGKQMWLRGMESSVTVYSLAEFDKN